MSSGVHALEAGFSNESMQTVTAVIHSCLFTILTVEEFIQIFDETVMFGCSLRVE